MKKYFKLLALAFIPLVLASCKNDSNINVNNDNESHINDHGNSDEKDKSNSGNENNQESENQSSDNNQENTQPDENGNGVEDSQNENNQGKENQGENGNGEENSDNGNGENVDQPKEVKVGELYISTSWDNTIRNMAKTVLGDLWDKVPEFIAPEYDAKIIESHDGDDEFLVFQVRCYGPNFDTAIRLYQEKLEECGFTLSAGNYYGYLMKSKTEDLFVSYGVGDTLESFDISAVIRKTRDLVWDKTFINLYAGTEVPVCPAEAYNCYYDNYKEQVYVYAQFVDDNALKNYENILKAAHYTYSSLSTTESLIYTDPTGYVSVQVYETAGDYNRPALYITITNYWPSIGIISFTGIADFPKLESETAVYYSYTYMNVGTEQKPEDDRIAIYYDNCSNVDLNDYINKLVNNYNFEITETSNTGDIISFYLTLKGITANVDIAVHLKTSINRICIVIYPVISEVGE